MLVFWVSPLLLLTSGTVSVSGFGLFPLLLVSSGYWLRRAQVASVAPRCFRLLISPGLGCFRCFLAACGCWLCRVQVASAASGYWFRRVQIASVASLLLPAVGCAVLRLLLLLPATGFAGFRLLLLLPATGFAGFRLLPCFSAASGCWFRRVRVVSVFLCCLRLLVPPGSGCFRVSLLLVLLCFFIPGITGCTGTHMLTAVFFVPGIWLYRYSNVHCCASVALLGTLLLLLLPFLAVALGGALSASVSAS